MRITVQLTSSADGEALWQNSYENDKGDVFQVQDEVTASLTRAVSSYRAAIDRDPTFARAYAALGQD